LFLVLVPTIVANCARKTSAAKDTQRKKTQITPDLVDINQGYLIGLRVIM